MPAFFRGASRQLAYLNPEPDRWRGGVERDHDPALTGATAPDHYINLERIPEARRAGALRAPHRFAHLDSLRAAGVATADAGMLPYRILEMAQRLRVDFRHWRAAPDAETRGWIEQRILNDAGVLGHYVTDASNPAHTSIHHNGWVGANPHGYAVDGRFHARFESIFVQSRVTEADIRDAVRAAGPARVFPDLRTAVTDHVMQSHARIDSLYALDKIAAFDSTNTRPGHEAFAVARLSAGAVMLRDLWWTAWVTSAGAPPAR